MLTETAHGCASLSCLRQGDLHFLQVCMQRILLKHGRRVCNGLTFPSGYLSEDAFLHTLSCYIAHFSASFNCMPLGPSAVDTGSSRVASSGPLPPPAPFLARSPLKSSSVLSEARRVTRDFAHGYGIDSSVLLRSGHQSDDAHLFTSAALPLCTRRNSKPREKEARAVVGPERFVYEERESGTCCTPCGSVSSGAANADVKGKRRKQGEAGAATAEPKVEEQVDGRWWLSSAVDGCFLEGVNLTVDMFATKYVDYPCGLTSQHLLIVTAGNGVFHVSRLGELTKRMAQHCPLTRADVCVVGGHSAPTVLGP